MKNIAVIHLEATYLQMKIFNMDFEGFPFLVETESEAIHLYEDILNGNLVTPNKYNEIIKVLEKFKKICAINEVSQTYAIMPNYMRKIKDYKSVFDHLTAATTIGFTSLEENVEIFSLASAVNMSLESNKNFILNVGDRYSNLIYNGKKFNIKHLKIDSGVLSILNYAKEKGLNSEDFFEKIDTYFAETMPKSVNNFIPDDSEDNVRIVYMSRFALALTKLMQKKQKYPFEHLNGYEFNLNNLDKIISLIKTLPFGKDKYIKSISEASVDEIYASVAMLKYILKTTKISEVVVVDKDMEDGYLLSSNLFALNEKYSSDLMMLCSDANRQYYNEKTSDKSNIYDKAVSIFKECKSIHRYAKAEMKILKLAGIFADSGRRIGRDNLNKKSFSILMQTNITGTTHREQILAAFIILAQNLEDFSIVEWTKYKDILLDGDIEIVRKLACLLRVASALNIYENPNIERVECDVLGDSVILKLISNDDIEYEKKEAFKIYGDFKKVYNKDLTVF